VRKLKKYKKLLGLSELAELGAPQFLIPPYFLFEHHGDDWYRVSLACLKAAASIQPEIPLRPVMHFKDWLAPQEWRRIIDDVTALGVPGMWMYPDNFKEHDQLEDSLSAYRWAVATTQERGLRGHILFGGYFAMLMHYFGLMGFSNGIGYGEWRHSGYHRGGTALNRIYVLKLHRYLDPPAAQHIIEVDPEYFASDSELLSECVGIGRGLSDLTLSECLDHFMECRLSEMTFVNTSPLEEAAAELEATVAHLGAIGPLEREQYGESLAKWAQVLRASSG